MSCDGNDNAVRCRLNVFISLLHFLCDVNYRTYYHAKKESNVFLVEQWNSLGIFTA